MYALAWIAEQRIQDAVNRGELDDLPGKGKPLELEDDSDIPADLRMAYKILKNSGYVPPEIEDRKEAQTIVDFLKNCTDEKEKIRQMRRLDVILTKIEQSRQRPISLSDASFYYDKVIDRVTLPEKNPEKQ